MLRLTSILLTLALVLSTASLTAAQTPSVEKLLKEARLNAQKETQEIANIVRGETKKFRNKGNRAVEAWENARTRLISLGFGAVPAIVEEIRGTKNKNVLTQLGQCLLGMHEDKKAESQDIATELRGLLDAKEPIHTATAIAVLGAIEDKGSLDAIRLMKDREDVDVRAAVLVALARLGDETCFPTLEAAAANDETKLRIAAAQAYGIIGRNPQDQKVMVALVEDAEDDVVVSALRSLERISLNSRAMAALHETLKHDNVRFVRVAIEVIERIGKKTYSGRHLLQVVKNGSLEWELRVTAAKALFRMGDKEGMMELTSSYKRKIKARPRSSVPLEELARFYVEFGDWPLAAKTFEKAIDKTRDGRTQYNYRIDIARCWARHGTFKKAASALKKAGLKDDWKSLKDDEAFAEMKKEGRYKKNFE